MNRKLSFLTLATLLLMGMFSSCNGEKSIPTSMLNGDWTGGIVTSGFGDMDTEISFEVSKTDSTAGTFIIFFEGTCNDTDEDSTKFSVRYLAATNGTYKVEGDKLTLTYIPDSVGVRVDLGDVMHHAINKQNKGAKGDVIEIAKQFRGNIVGFIGSSFEELFTELNNDNQFFYIKLLDAKGLKIIENGGDQTISFTRATGKNADEQNEAVNPEEEAEPQGEASR